MQQVLVLTSCYRIKFIGILEVLGLILVVLCPKVYVGGNQIQALTLSQTLRQVRKELEWF